MRGGLTRCARPAGSPPRCAGLSNWLRQLSNPDGGSHHPSRRCNMRKKSLNASSGFLFEDGGERGIDSLRSPCGQPVALRWSVQLAAPVVEPRRVFSSPLSEVQHAKKSLNVSSGFLFKYGGERGIRTPDTLPYTHFPGVLLQPLGHLTVLLSRWRDGR